MIVVLAFLLASAFGAGDQYLGSFSAHPLFGWFGQRWRTERAWLGAIVTSLAILFEPFAHILAGRSIRFVDVSAVEIAVGAAMSFYVVVSSRRTPVRDRG